MLFQYPSLRNRRKEARMVLKMQLTSYVIIAAILIYYMGK
jgi:hypothetical protein